MFSITRLISKFQGARWGWHVGAEIARHPVTNLPLRVIFERLERTQLEKRRKTGKSVLVLLDVNRLHFINSALGHPGGDIILLELAQIVENRLRSEDRIYHWGGDEILVLLDETDLTGAFVFVSRIETAVGRYFRDRLSEEYRRVARRMTEYLENSGQRECIDAIDYVFPLTGLAAGIAEWPRAAGMFDKALGQAAAMLRMQKELVTELR